MQSPSLVILFPIRTVTSEHPHNSIVVILEVCMSRIVVYTFPSCKLFMLDVLIVHLEAPQEVVVLGDSRAVRQNIPQSCGEAACRSEHARSHLIGLLRQVWLFL